MKGLLNLLIVLVVLPSICQAQKFKKELSEQEIEGMRSEILEDYQYYLEGILNLIDNDLSYESKVISRNLMLSIFDNSNSTIRDYLENPNPERKSAIEYTSKIMSLANDLPIFKKRFKFTDSIKIIKSDRGYNLKDQKERIDYERIFQVYHGEVYVLEQVQNSRMLHTDREMPIVNLYNKEMIKKLNFRIAHNANDEYTMGITSIDLIEKKDNNNEYDKIRNEILGSSYQWSDRAEEEYIKELSKHLEQDSAIVIDIPKPKPPTVQVEENYEIPKITLWEYLNPGSGYDKFVRTDKAKRINTTYKSVLGITALAAGYFKYRQIDYENKRDSHLGVEALQYSQKANRQEQYFNGALAGIGATFLYHIVDLNSRLKGQKRNWEQIRNVKGRSYGYSIDLDFSPSKVALSYTF